MDKREKLERLGLVRDLEKIRDGVFVDQTVPGWLQHQKLTRAQKRRISKAHAGLVQAHAKFVLAVGKVRQEVEAGC